MNPVDDPRSPPPEPENSGWPPRHRHAPWGRNHTWPRDWERRRRRVFRRVLFTFLAFFLFFLLALLGVIVAALKLVPEAAPDPGWFVLLGCGIPALFGLVLLFLGGLAFRRFGWPTVNVLAAIDAIAAGDFSVRLRENVPGELGRLARSFNRMAAELERAEQQRRNLTADLAHELRNPLHILQGNLEGLIDGLYQPSPQQVEVMLEETRLLSRLVDDLQTLSLAESGQLTLHRSLVFAEDLLSDVAANFGPAAQAAGVALRIDVPDQAGKLSLEVDGDRLGQVLSNLVANALRYTPAGGTITLSARPLPQGVELTVHDPGEGIPPEDLPFVFDRFWRGDRSRTRREGAGSGLGLAIARQLVRAHGGEISVESQPGQGTTFSIELPASGP